MGANRVGKSSLITQFLYSRYNSKYKRTIEEMHQGNFNVAGVGLTLDILDTSGSNEVSLASSASYLRRIRLPFIFEKTPMFATYILVIYDSIPFHSKPF